MQFTSASPLSLECATMIAVDDAPPIMAIIEDLTMTSCRLRSTGAFREGTSAAFDVHLRGAPKIRLLGRVQSAVSAGARWVYSIHLERTAEQGALLLQVIEAAKRHAADHADEPVPAAPAGLTRSSVRVACDMSLRYRTPDGASYSGRATNISTGGILLNSVDKIAVGSSIELRFTLPGNARELKIAARVVAHQEQSPNYNMAFHDIAPQTRQAIDDYVSLNRST